MGKSKTVVNEDVKELSILQRTIQVRMQSCNDEVTRSFFKQYRNRILTEIHTIITLEENEKVNKAMEDLKDLHDNNKMYQAVKKIKNLKPTKNLLIKGKNGLTANPTEQSEIIAEYFKNTFYKNQEPATIILPTPMTTPFTPDKINKIVRKMKENKSPGCDDIPIELIKHAPESVHQQIADIYNSIAETGDTPKEVTFGILKPLQKPNKAKGPPSNIRPIILLSSLRKILAACIINRIRDRLDAEIPLSQAAYRSKRSTTEHVFTTKLIIEKTITSKNEAVHLILLDMSKAFDSLNRNILLQDLQNTIEPDELHIISVLLNVSLAVRCQKTMSKSFETDTGAPQGDCVSANEFTYYLAKALSPIKSNQLADHPYADHRIISSVADHLAEHNYSTITLKNHIDIEMEYADDIGKITSNHSALQSFKKNVTECLKVKNLTINQDKTEEFLISRNSQGWKKCKYLGSMLDTEEDIKRRKTLSITAANKLQSLFYNKKLTIQTKMLAFTTYIEPIFLYNCELWSVTLVQAENKIDAFHRRLLRTYVINVKLPDVMSNQDVYRKTTTISWSKIIRNRRLKWFGKVARTDASTPMKLALNYASASYQKPPGRPTTTWLSIVKNDLKKLNLTWNEAIDIAQNTKEWDIIISR